MVVFTVFIDGGLEDVHTFEVEESTKGIITVTLPYTTAVSIDDTFEIKTDGSTWIKGKVQRIKKQREGMTDVKVLTCYGKTHTLYEKYCLDYGHHQYFNKDVGWIANDLVDHYFSGILTSVNINVTTGVVLTHFEADGRSVGEALEILASRGDCNFYVDNSDDVYFFTRPGAASGLTVEGLGEIKIVDESGRKFVKVIVRGRHRAIQASAGANYPEFFYQDDRIISIAEAQEVADAMVAELGSVRKQVVAREDSFMETRAGKTIILNVPDDGFNNQVIEIQKIRWVCKQPNLNKTYFTLGDKEPTIDSVLANIARGVTWLPDVQIQRGDTFPTDPFDGMAFSLTDDVNVPGDYYGAPTGILYTWDEANSVWKRPPGNLGRRGADPPAGGEIDGDKYYNTADDKTYQWDSGVPGWVFVATATHDNIGDVGLDDHHDEFTPGQHAVFEHTASMLNQAIQPYNSNILFERKAGQEDDGITYTAGNIAFQDGTTRVITNPGELLALPIGYTYIYFRTDSAVLHATQTHTVAISVGRGLLAIILVVADDDTDQPCAIQPFHAKGLNVTADTMSVILLSAITALLGNVTIAAGDILLGDTGIIIKGKLLSLISDDETHAGDVWMDDDLFTISTLDDLLLYALGQLTVQSINGPLFITAGTDLYLDTGAGDFVIVPAGALALITTGAATLGTVASPWPEAHADDIYGSYYVPITVIGSRPAAESGIIGLVWQTRASAGQKTYTWQCVQKSDNSYGWMQTGVSN